MRAATPAAFVQVYDSPTELVINSRPASDLIAGAPFAFAVTALDANGAVDSGDNGTVQLFKYPGGGQIGSLTLENGLGELTVSFLTAGSQTVTASETLSTGQVISGTLSLVIDPAAPATIAFSNVPAAITAGGTVSFTSTAQDAYGNTITSDDDPVQVKFDGQTETINLNSGMGSGSAILTQAGSQTLSASDALAGVSGSSTPILVKPGAPSRLTVSGFASPTVAGVAHNFVIQVTDGYGNLITNDDDSVTLASSDAKVVWRGGVAKVTLSGGTATVSATLETAGTQSITASDAADGLSNSQRGITIVAAAPAKLSVTGFPVSTAAGAEHSFSVVLQDVYGNVILDNDDTLELSSSDPKAAWPGGNTLTLSGGQVSSSAILTTAGAAQSIVVADPALGLAGEETGITVQPGGATTLEVSGYPTGTRAGAAHTFTVEALDPFGNIATGYTGTVTITSSDPHALFQPPQATLSDGQGNFSGTYETAGLQSLTAEDLAALAANPNSQMRASETGITVVNSPATQFAIIGLSATTLAGAPQTVTVQAEDQYGNPDSSYTGTVVLTSTDFYSTPIDLAILADQGGHASATFVFHFVGPETLFASDGIISSEPAVTDVFSDSPLGTASQVNTFTATNDQVTQAETPRSVAMDGRGDYVVTWTSFGQDDPPGYTSLAGDIVAQRFDTSGNPLGNEFQVNTAAVPQVETDESLQGSTVAMDPTGDFVITWESSVGAIFARRYQADGTPLGGQFMVNAVTDGNPINASVAMDTSGGFVITWQSDTGYLGNSIISAQRYDANGVPQGGEVQVNTTDPYDATEPTVAMDAAGDFVIVWLDNESATAGFQVNAQQFAADGSPLGGEFRVDADGTSQANQLTVPTAAMQPDGAFVITWSGAGPYNSDLIYARRYQAGGASLGGPFGVDTVAYVGTEYQEDPVVAIDAVGDFVVSWSESYPNETTGQPVIAQRYDSSGQPLGTSFLVAQPGSMNEAGAAVAMNPDGGFVVDWTSYNLANYNPDGSSNGVYAQRFAAATDTAGPTVGGVYVADDLAEQVTQGQRLVETVPQLVVTFSEDLAPATVTDLANWSLSRNGVDVSTSITGVSFQFDPTTGEDEATLTFSSPLGDGSYVLTVNDGITDVYGNALDGNDDGTPGSDFTSAFAVAVPVPSGPAFVVDQPSAGQDEDNIGGYAPNGIATNDAGDTVVTWLRSALD